MPRNSISRLRAATAAALLSLSLAAPALAHDWDDDRGQPAYRHDTWRGDAWRNRDGDRDHDDWRDGRWRDRDGDRDGWRDRDGWNRGAWDGRGRDGYWDRPCHRRFGDRGAFYRHLAREHGVPFWAFPRVVTATPWGTAYFGR